MKECKHEWVLLKEEKATIDYTRLNDGEVDVQFIPAKVFCKYCLTIKNL